MARSSSCGTPSPVLQCIAISYCACAKSPAAAWYHLGVLTADGRGLDRDLREAMRLMSLAAKDGVQDAKDQLEDIELAMTRESRG